MAMRIKQPFRNFFFFSLRFGRTWTKRYLTTSQTRVKRVSRNRLSRSLPLSFSSSSYFPSFSKQKSVLQTCFDLKLRFSMAFARALNQRCFMSLIAIMKPIFFSLFDYHYHRECSVRFSFAFFFSPTLSPFQSMPVNRSSRDCHKNSRRTPYKMVKVKRNGSCVTFRIPIVQWQSISHVCWELKVRFGSGGNLWFFRFCKTFPSHPLCPSTFRFK